LLSGLPLMLGHGAGSELRRPLGFAMVGGLLLSQLLTLFTTPIIYLYLDRAHYWVESKRAARKTRQEQVRPGPESSSTMVKPEVLIIEDERKTADYLCQGLTEQGWTVDVAHDGIDGQHLAVNYDFDVVVLDVMLPGLSGWTSCAPCGPSRTRLSSC
jgi:hypothetical protein